MQLMVIKLHYNVFILLSLNANGRHVLSCILDINSKRAQIVSGLNILCGLAGIMILYLICRPAFHL